MTKSKQVPIVIKDGQFTDAPRFVLCFPKTGLSRFWQVKRLKFLRKSICIVHANKYAVV